MGRGRVDAVRVDEHLDIELSDGRIVRLRGLDTPNGDHGRPRDLSSAREFSANDSSAETPDLIQLAGGTDRWGRMVADP
jgi:hypothetical protein